MTPDLLELMAPLERFEAIQRRFVRLGSSVSDLSYANPYDGAPPEVREVLREAVDDERKLSLQYAPFGGQTRARRACADGLRDSHGLDVRFSDVVLTPGAMSALQLALWSVHRPAGEVVIPVPSWLDHPLYVRVLGMTPRLVLLPAPNFELDVAAIADAITPHTTAVLLSQPSNPSGASYPAGAFAELANAIRTSETRTGNAITLICDETHRDFTISGPYVSGANHHDRTLIAYSFGKYHLMQGQRLGYLAVSPNHPERSTVAENLVRWTRATGVATPTAVMQRAVPALLALRHDHGHLLERKSWLVSQMADRGWRMAPSADTFFIYAQVPGGGDDFEFVESVAASGLLVLPAGVFHHGGWFRISVTGSDQMVERAAQVLEEVAP